MNYRVYLSELYMRFNDCEERILAYEHEHKDVLLAYQELLEERKAIIGQFQELSFLINDK